MNSIVNLTLPRILESSFNPYKAVAFGTNAGKSSFVSVSKETDSEKWKDNANSGERKETYADKLEELKWKRDAMIPNTITNRNPELIILKPNQTVGKTFFTSLIFLPFLFIQSSWPCQDQRRRFRTSSHRRDNFQRGG